MLEITQTVMSLDADGRHFATPAAHTLQIVAGADDFVRVHVVDSAGTSGGLKPAGATVAYTLTIRKRPGDEALLTIAGDRQAGRNDTVDFAISGTITRAKLAAGRYVWDAWLVDTTPGADSRIVLVPASPMVVLVSVR